MSTAQFPAQLNDVLVERLKHHGREGGDDPDELAAQLMTELEGEHPDVMFDTLDALRTSQLYDVSTVLLEAAWNAELPANYRGRVAEDWLGTVAKGLGDHDGLRIVAEYLVRTLGEHDAAFASDLAHLLLSYELYSVAEPLVIEAATSMPGDVSAKFHLGVIHKFARRWSDALDAFQSVAAIRPDDKASLWNIGIAATALRRWPLARTTWTQIGIQLPNGEHDFSGPEGEQLPVRLSCDPGSPTPYEAIWAVRIGPARARLKGIPRFSSAFGFNDDVIIDGVPVAELNGADGQRHSVFAALDRFNTLNRPVVALRSESIAPSQVDHVLDALRQLSIPLADWRVFDFDTTYCIAVSMEPSSTPVGTLTAALATLNLPDSMVWETLASTKKAAH